jgi:hypothetical protein
MFAVVIGLGVVGSVVCTANSQAIPPAASHLQIMGFYGFDPDAQVKSCFFRFTLLCSYVLPEVCWTGVEVELPTTITMDWVLTRFPVPPIRNRIGGVDKPWDGRLGFSQDLRKEKIR